MLTGKYHIGSIVAIFFALGIGILIGGTLGQQWMFQTEQHTVSVLMNKYEKQLLENQNLQKHIGFLQLMQRSLIPMLEHKRILWIRSSSNENKMLAQMMKLAGADWAEAQADSWLNEWGKEMRGEGEKRPDLIVISDPKVAKQFQADLHTSVMNPQASYPTVMDISTESFSLDDPQGVVDFIIHLRNTFKDGENELDDRTEPVSGSIDYYSGLE